MRWAEVANTRAQITRLLAEHGLGPRAPPAERVNVRVPEQMVLGFGLDRIPACAYSSARWVLTDDLALSLDGDTATGTYAFYGTGLSSGSCDAMAKATRVK